MASAERELRKVKARLAAASFEQSSDFAAQCLARVVPNALANVVGTVAFTGWLPYDADELAQYCPPGSQPYIESDDWPSNAQVELLVVGMTDFDTDIVDRAIEENPTDIKILPQEGFVDLILNGSDWWTVDINWLDLVAEYHPALQYIRELDDFEWPTTEAEETSGLGSTESAEFRSQTRLRQLGYQITGLNHSQRWRILTTKALPQLPLREVAETIAMNTRSRKQQIGGRHKYRHAIREWEHDLARLKRELYDGRTHGFRWPSTEP
jgi:hypothetical protein